MRHYYQDLFLDRRQKTFYFATFKQTLRHHLFLVFYFFLRQLNPMILKRVGEMATRFFMAIFMAKVKKGLGLFQFCNAIPIHRNQWLS